MEETGLEVRIKRLIGIYSDPASQVFCYPNGKNVHFVTSCFEAEIVGGALDCTSPESLDVKFFSPSCLPKNILAIIAGWQMLYVPTAHLLSGEYMYRPFSPLSRNRKGFPVV